ncbi:hypothetical protein [Phosphitispora sp. TUW77]|uniref:hypothetical protein n=1 Tax=Phosphitispora sp. TUW77 TaxID=3152361 RepID=UPI003AB58B24
MEGQEIKIDEKVVERLKKWIIIQENVNLKKRTFNDQQMVDKIKKRIEEEVKCCLNQ